MKFWEMFNWISGEGEWVGTLQILTLSFNWMDFVPIPYSMILTKLQTIQMKLVSFDMTRKFRILEKSDIFHNSVIFELCK
jgi:hypothetical protein